MQFVETLTRNEMKNIMAGIRGSCGDSTNFCNCYCCPTNTNNIDDNNCEWQGTLSTECGGTSH